MPKGSPRAAAWRATAAPALTASSSASPGGRGSIDQDHHRAAGALGRAQHLGLQPAALGRLGPVDARERVAGQVVADPVELAEARQRQAPARAAAVAAGAEQQAVDGRRLRRHDDGVVAAALARAPGEPEGVGDPQPRRRQAVVAARRRAHPPDRARPARSGGSGPPALPRPGSRVRSSSRSSPARVGQPLTDRRHGERLAGVKPGGLDRPPHLEPRGGRPDERRHEGRERDQSGAEGRQRRRPEALAGDQRQRAGRGEPERADERPVSRLRLAAGRAVRRAAAHSGTGTASSAETTTSSAREPRALASGVRISRWGSTEPARALTSSGST